MAIHEKFGRHALRKLSTTQLLCILLVLAAVIIGYLISQLQYATSQLQTQSNSSSSQRTDVSIGHLPPLGNPNAKVKIIEFADFQCPFCRSFFNNTLPQLKKDYLDTGKAVLYYRYFPLPADLHPQAEISAEAGECANEQGKFWIFHDKIYTEQSTQGTGTVLYTEPNIELWASQISLNIPQFHQCLTSGKEKSIVGTDQQYGASIGVTGTPTFYINGIQIVGDESYTTFKTTIDQELAGK